jgi:hypothetical protein
MSGWAIYQATKKKHDFFFNTFVMRPIAAYVVALFAPTRITPNQVTLLSQIVFGGAAAALVALPTYIGGLIAIGLVQVSYCFDCVDGMLARYKKIASRTGHLFDFFTDESKALMLVAATAIRLFRTGGLGCDGREWQALDVRFLLAGIVAVFTVASATSLTNFVRRPELSGREQQVEAYYETVGPAKPKGLVGTAGGFVFGALRLVAHYPSHIVLVALAGRFDVFFWAYAVVHVLYLGRGWLGLFVRFGVRGE